MMHRLATRTAAATLAASGLAATFSCAGAQSREGTLTFTPRAPVVQIQAGLQPLGLGTERDGFLFVPRGNAAGHAQPLLILLHGATQRARLFERMTPAADSAGVVILAPDSREMTWDAIRGRFGADVAFLQRAIGRAFDRAHIDPCRVVIGGFSDGATYGLSLGIRNAHALQGVVAFSPGFVIPAREAQQLPVFIRHGTEDRILPIDRTSRRILAALRDAGFTVDYEEFSGPHTIRAADARAALRWVTQRSCAQAGRGRL
jgi:phospholipase/carboxylesterase